MARLLSRIEARLDRARFRISEGLHGQRASRVVPYHGYGTTGEVRVRGRVLYGDPPGPASPDDRWYTNLLNAYRRIESDEVPRARVRVRFQGTKVEAVANDEGHFTAVVPVGGPLPAGYWHDARVELAAPAGHGARAAVAVPSNPRFGVISDLDDTVVQTNARDLLRMAREVLFGNAHTRIPFAGVGAFYRALHTAGQNPIFYVSSSPWNLYGVITQFLQLHRIPAGPMELRDWGITAEQILPTRHRAHKRAAIERLMGAYPDLPFLLVGDSGQEDPEIYRDVVHDHPERVLGIYIRNVTPEAARQEAVRELAEELARHDVELVLADDTLTAARHAAERGWIDPAAIEDVARDRARENEVFDRTR